MNTSEEGRACRHLEAGALQQLLKEQLRQRDAQGGPVGKALPQQPAGPAVLLLPARAPDQAGVEPEASGVLAPQKQCRSLNRLRPPAADARHCI